MSTAFDPSAPMCNLYERLSWLWDNNDDQECTIDNSYLETGTWLYWNFSPKEEEPDNESPDSRISQEELEKTWVEWLENNKYMPIINRLFETWKISSETKSNIELQLLDNPKQLNLSKIEWITSSEKTILTKLLSKINNKENKIEHFNDFKTDSSKFWSIPWLWDYDFWLDQNWNFNIEALSKVSKNYIQFPEKEWNRDFKADLSTAIISTKNEILINVKNIKINTITYETAIKNINSDDIKKQLEWINSLYTLAYSNEWTLAKVKVDMYREMRKDELISEYKRLNLEVELLRTKEETEGNKQKIKVLKDEITIIWNEAKEIDSWEIFNSSDFDTGSGNNDSYEDWQQSTKISSETV